MLYYFLSSPSSTLPKDVPVPPPEPEALIIRGPMPGRSPVPQPPASKDTEEENQRVRLSLLPRLGGGRGYRWNGRGR